MLRTFLVLVLFIPILCLTAFANPEITTSEDQTTVIVNDAPEQDVISFGKSVIVIKRAKGVLVVGGDITIEGRVEGDVATIGGNIVQKENAYIGGEVIAIGGSYKPESTSPLREAGKQTIVLGVFEEELRSFGQDPSSVFAPEFFARVSGTAAFYRPCVVCYFARFHDACSGSGQPGRCPCAAIVAQDLCDRSRFVRAYSHGCRRRKHNAAKLFECNDSVPRCGRRAARFCFRPCRPSGQCRKADPKALPGGQ